MARNGAGVYSLPSGNPVVTGTTISSTTYNNTLTDIASALTGSVASDGQTPMTGNLPMGSNKVTGLANGSARTDVPAVGQVQDGSFIYVGTVGGTTDVITLSPSPAISSYTAGQTFRFIASGANTTNVTVNVSSLGAKAVTKNGTTALVANDIPSGAIIEIVYDGTQFQMIGVVGTLAQDSAVIHNTLTTTTGDMIYASGANTPARLAVGATGMALVGGTTPAWADHVELGSPTGGSKGAGTLSAASGIYDNGNKVSHILLATVTASNSATVDFTSFIDATFKKYLVRIVDMVPVSTGFSLQCRIHSGGVFKSGGTDYTYAIQTSTGATWTGGSSSASLIPLSGGAGVSNAAGASLSGEIEIYNPSEATYSKLLTFKTVYLDNAAGAQVLCIGSARTVSTAVDGIQFFMSTGNISLGTFELFGFY